MEISSNEGFSVKSKNTGEGSTYVAVSKSVIADTPKLGRYSQCAPIGENEGPGEVTPPMG